MNMQAILKQAQSLQKDMMKTKEEIDNMTFTGTSSFISVTVKGTKEVLKVNIDNNELSSDDKEMIEVASIDEIELGKAYIYTVVEGIKKEKFEINILKIEKDTNTKNILFEIKDNDLLDKTGGIVKGMSGSPIIQNDKLIGAVTHAIQTKNNMGYGIFITTMLEEGER